MQTMGQEQRTAVMGKTILRSLAAIVTGYHIALQRPPKTIAELDSEFPEDGPFDEAETVDDVADGAIDQLISSLGGLLCQLVDTDDLCELMQFNRVARAHDAWGKDRAKSFKMGCVALGTVPTIEGMANQIEKDTGRRLPPQLLVDIGKVHKMETAKLLLRLKGKPGIEMKGVANGNVEQTGQHNDSVGAGVGGV